MIFTDGSVNCYVVGESMTMVGISSEFGSSCDAATDNETARRATFRSMSPSAEIGITIFVLENRQIKYNYLKETQSK